MTREEALKNLNLPPDADREAVEKAYQRLARRYPPEFHPEKFRLIDDSYRHLTSLAAMIQMLLTPSVDDEKPDPDILDFHPSVSDSLLDEALAEIRASTIGSSLWKPPPSERGRKK